MNDLTREEIRALVDTWKVNNDPLDLAAQVEAPRRSGKVHFIHCPFHNDQNKPNMAVYPDGYKCFACGWAGDQVAFILAINGWDFRQFIDWIASFGVDPAPLNTPPATKPPKQSTPLDSGLVARFRGRMVDQHYDVWKAQGIYSDVLDKFQIGHAGRQWAIPHFYRGVLMGIKLRWDDRLPMPEDMDKYRSVRGSHYDAPYNIDSVLLPEKPPNVVLINEDEKSVWAQASYGLVGISAPAGKWSPEWSNLIRHVPEIIIVQNADEAGVKAARERQKSLRRARIVCFDPDKDFFDLHKRVWDIPGSDLLVMEWLGLA